MLNREVLNPKSQANLTLEEAAEQAPAVDDAPRSCIDVIVTSQAKDRRRRAEEVWPSLSSPSTRKGVAAS
jgi:hypothetical protein